MDGDGKIILSSGPPTKSLRQKVAPSGEVYVPIFFWGVTISGVSGSDIGEVLSPSPKGRFDVLGWKNAEKKVQPSTDTWKYI